jgi:hypothetical protein
MVRTSHDHVQSNDLGMYASAHGCAGSQLQLEGATMAGSIERAQQQIVQNEPNCPQLVKRSGALRFCAMRRAARAEAKIRREQKFCEGHQRALGSRARQNVQNEPNPEEFRAYPPASAWIGSISESPSPPATAPHRAPPYIPFRQQ